MSNKKQEPLLSDQSIRETFMYGSLILDAEHGFMSGANYARHEYEDARAKDAELIQQMLDVLIKSLDPLAFAYQQARLPITEHEFRKTYKLANDILNAAEAAGFKPSDQ
jgi:hypothetical protein